MQNFPDNEQLSLFDLSQFEEATEFSFEESEDAYASFNVLNIRAMSFSNELSFIYSTLEANVPNEKVSFSRLGIQDAIICELICAAICHQINWDFLRQVIYNVASLDPHWLSIQHISNIQPYELDILLSTYSKPERIKAKERSKILRKLGSTYSLCPNGFHDIFFTEFGLPQTYEHIRDQLLVCDVFSNDIVGKKFQLLLMKISAYKGFEGLGEFCEPTIDYHLLRSFLRRGFLIPKTKYAIDIVFSHSYRRDSTVGAVRRHCVNIVNQLCQISGISVGTINHIEWWIGRSVCKEGHPDCDIKESDSAWLQGSFTKCPFYDFCKAIQRTKAHQYQLIESISSDCEDDYLILDGPKYKGNNY